MLAAFSESCSMSMPVSRKQARTLKHRLWVAFLVVPPIVFMSLFVVYPILSAFAYAFYDWQGLARGEFVGLKNFKEVLFGATMAPVVWNAFLHNVYALVALMIIQNGGGFLLAWLLYKEPFGFRFHRVAVFVPVVLSTIIVGFLWKLFLNPNFGIVNQALYSLGLDSLAKPWLGDSSTALGALILANAWHFVGFPTLVYLAGMQRIPPEIIEAARLDGTNEWQLLKNIVWPLVAPSTTILFTLLFIGAFNWFEIPYVMVGPRRLALRHHRRAGPRLLPHGLRQPERQHPEFRHGLGAGHADLPLHRRLRVHADPVAAPSGDPVLTAIASDTPASRQPISFALLAQIILIANSFIMLYPVVVMVLSAFKTTGEIFEHPFALPDFTQVGNFAKVLGETVDADLFHELDPRDGHVDRADPRARHHGGLCGGALRVAHQHLHPAVLPRRPDAAAEARGHPALHPAARSRPARQPLEPHRHLHGHRPAVGRVHHGGLPAHAAGGARGCGAHRRGLRAAHHVVGHAAAGAPAHGDRGDPERGADLERLLLPARLHPDRCATRPCRRA